MSGKRRRGNAGRGEEVKRLTHDYLPHALSRLLNSLNLRLMDVLRPLKMTTQQYRVMQVLLVHQVASIGAISRDAVIEQSVVSRVVDQLEKRGFVTRRRRPSNARIVEVSLTPFGLSVLRSINPHAQEIVAQAVGVLSSRDRQTLFRLLSAVLKTVHAPSAG